MKTKDAMFRWPTVTVAHPSAQVRVVAYDLSEPGVVERLEQLGPRLRIIIDDAGDHGEAGSGELALDLRDPRSKHPPIERAIGLAPLLRYTSEPMPELPDVTVYIEALDARIGRARLEGVRLASPFVLRSVDPPLADADCESGRGWGRERAWEQV